MFKLAFCDHVLISREVIYTLFLNLAKTWLLTLHWKLLQGAQELCEQGGGAGLSPNELYSLLLQFLSTAGSLDTFFVSVFATTVERASGKAWKLPCAGWLPTALTSIVLVVAVLLAFASGQDIYMYQIYPFPTPIPNRLQFLWMLSPTFLPSNTV